MLGLLPFRAAGSVGGAGERVLPSLGVQGGDLGLGDFIMDGGMRMGLHSVVAPALRRRPVIGALASGWPGPLKPGLRAAGTSGMRTWALGRWWPSHVREGARGVSDRVEFRVLGPFEVVRDGSLVGPAGSKRRGVLAMMVLRANRAVPAGASAALRT
jgi:hypothetical protein